MAGKLMDGELKFWKERRILFEGLVGRFGPGSQKV